MIKTPCPDESTLQMYVESTVDVDQHGAIVEHAADCSRCRVRIGQYKQLMWDLQHPAPVQIPEGQAVVYDALMNEWRNRQAVRPDNRPSPRRLIPAWAGYSVLWTRNLPGFGKLTTTLQRSAATMRPTAVMRRSLARLLARR